MTDNERQTIKALATMILQTMHTQNTVVLQHVAQELNRLASKD